MYSSKIPTKTPGMLTHPLMSANPVSGSTGPSSCLPLTSVDCSLLLTALFCRLVSFALSVVYLLQSSSGLMGNLAHNPFVWVSHQNRQRDPLTGTHTHRNECHLSCHTINDKNIRKFFSSKHFANKTNLNRMKNHSHVQ